jgi:hypothetical protein
VPHHAAYEARRAVPAARRRVHAVRHVRAPRHAHAVRVHLAVGAAPAHVRRHKVEHLVRGPDGRAHEAKLLDARARLGRGERGRRWRRSARCRCWRCCCCCCWRRVGYGRRVSCRVVSCTYTLSPCRDFRGSSPRRGGLPWVQYIYKDIVGMRSLSSVQRFVITWGFLSGNNGYCLYGGWVGRVTNKRGIASMLAEQRRPL